MSWKTWRNCIVALGGVLVLFPWSPAPEAASESWRPAAPDEHQMAVLEQVSGWLTDSGAGYGELSGSLPEGLRLAIKRRSEAFEMFRRYNGDAALLDQLRPLPFGESIHAAAERHDLDSLLLAAVVEAESGFAPHVVSPQGAVGLTQVLPSTASAYGDIELENPEQNLDTGARYLRMLIERFDGDLELALAAYNAGPFNVQRYEGVPPFRETRHYVRKVLSIYVDHHRSVWQNSPAVDLLVN